MVGVPGRSKACHTCRKRRKGCDSLRPSCSQCLKANLPCGGYERARIFINSNAAAAAAAGGITSTPPPGGGGSTALSHHRGTTVALHDALARTAREDRYVSLFWDAFLPRGSRRPTAAAASCAWARSAQQLFRTDPALRAATLAASLAVLGMRAESAVAYGRALRCSAAAVGSLSDAALLASKFMTTYEMLFVGDFGGGGGGGEGGQDLLAQATYWRSHNMGSLAIMEARTPWSVVDGPGHEIFPDSRLVWTIVGLTQRKRTAMSQPAWKTVAWLKYPKGSRDILMDTFVEIPGLLEDIDLAMAMTESSEKNARIQELLEAAWKYDGELQHWNPTQQPDQTQTGCLAGESTETSFIDDLPDIHTSLLYWCSCLYLYYSLQILLQFQQSRSSEPHQSKQAPARVTDLQQYLRSICKALPKFFDSSAGKCNLLNAAFPLGAALQFGMVLGMDHISEEWSIVSELVRRPQSKAIMSFLNSLQRDDSTVGEQGRTR